MALRTFLSLDVGTRIAQPPKALLRRQTLLLQIFVSSHFVKALTEAAKMVASLHDEASVLTGWAYRLGSAQIL